MLVSNDLPSAGGNDDFRIGIGIQIGNGDGIGRTARHGNGEAGDIFTAAAIQRMQLAIEGGYYDLVKTVIIEVCHGRGSQQGSTHGDGKVWIVVSACIQHHHAAILSIGYQLMIGIFCQRGYHHAISQASTGGNAKEYFRILVEKGDGIILQTGGKFLDAVVVYIAHGDGANHV